MIHYLPDLPSDDLIEQKLGERTPFLLYDQALLKFSQFANWIAQFDFGFSLRAGEELKNIEHWPQFLKTFLPHTRGLSSSEIVIVALGGGSVGDFAGFLASVLKRGVALWQIPSTWLAAMDSAHGGKTALNVGAYKNQIGTFHVAEEVFICESVLSTQPDELKSAAYGELVKMAILHGGELLEKIETDRMWQLLPLAIDAKLKIVAKDPNEKLGYRQILNFGHTLGHALELHHNLPHGRAVLMGLDFAIEWSRARQMLPEDEHQRLQHLLRRYPVLKPKLNAGKLREALLHDKKVIHGSDVRFVFVRAAGKPFVESVPVESVVGEAIRQGWCHD